MSDAYLPIGNGSPGLIWMISPRSWPRRSTAKHRGRPLYPGFIKHRSEAWEAPDLEFYESFAQQAFRSVEDEKLAAGALAHNLFGALSEAMPAAR